MQLYLMLKIFVCDAWLALWFIFRKKKSLEQLRKTKQFSKQR